MSGHPTRTHLPLGFGGKRLALALGALGRLLLDKAGHSDQYWDFASDSSARASSLPGSSVSLQSAAWLSDQTKGLALAISSSIFIGSSYIIKKKGLRLAAVSGLRAGAAQVNSLSSLAISGLSKSWPPLFGRDRRLLIPSATAMVGGPSDHGGGGDCQLCSVCLCACDPGHSPWRSQHHCQVCTCDAMRPGPPPLTCLDPSLQTLDPGLSPDTLPGVCSAVLAHSMLHERLNMFGMLGCVLCVTGSLTIVLHAPPERPVHSVLQLWAMASQPGVGPGRPPLLRSSCPCRSCAPGQLHAAVVAWLAC